MQVWQIMKDDHNNPKATVIIEKPESGSSAEPLMKEVYRGKLKNIPPEIALKTIESTRWSVENNCAVIRLTDPEDPEAQKRELLAICDADPELAKKCAAFLAASDFGQKMMMGKRVNELLSN